MIRATSQNSRQRSPEWTLCMDYLENFSNLHIIILLSGAIERTFKRKLRYVGYRIFSLRQKFVELGAIYLTCLGTEEVFKMIAKVSFSFKYPDLERSCRITGLQESNTSQWSLTVVFFHRFTARLIEEKCMTLWRGEHAKKGGKWSILILQTVLVNTICLSLAPAVLQGMKNETQSFPLTAWWNTGVSCLSINSFRNRINWFDNFDQRGCVHFPPQIFQLSGSKRKSVKKSVLKFASQSGLGSILI